MGRLFATLYDPVMARAEARTLAAWRHDLLQECSGVVVEIGAGTGANLPHYPATRIAELRLAEPDRHMRARLARRAAERFGARAIVLDASGERLPFASGTADVAVATLVLCSVPDPATVVAELARVLRPGGRLMFLEHVAGAHDSRLYRWQRRLDPIWRRCAGGCRLTRDPLPVLRAGGFAVERLESAPLRPAPPWVRPTVRGVAVRS